MWRHPEVVLAVFLRRSSPKAGRVGVPGERELVSRLHVVEGDPAAALVPVYFDFSALWSRVAGTSAPAHYPRALGGPAHRTPEVERWAAGGTFPYHLRELLSRTSPEVQAEGGPPKHRLGPFGLPRSRL